MSIYFQDDLVTVYHGDCREVLASMGDQSVAAVITDPPYAERTHGKARSRSGKENGKDTFKDGIAEFAAMTEDDLSQILTECGRVSSGWVIATLDYAHAFAFDQSPPLGLKCQRVGVWVKTRPTPQITGDRPAQGWEAISYLHREKGKSKWNGGGLHGNYHLDFDNTQGHPTAKPVPMLQDMVRKFTSEGDMVLDPFAGSGATLVAAVNEGRRAVGVELNERYCEIIANRLSNQTMALDFSGGGA